MAARTNPTALEIRPQQNGLLRSRQLKIVVESPWCYGVASIGSGLETDWASIAATEWAVNLTITNNKKEENSASKQRDHAHCQLWRITRVASRQSRSEGRQTT